MDQDQDTEFDAPTAYAELFEKTANDSAAWVDSAQALAAAAEAVKRDDDNTGGGKVFADTGNMTPKRGAYAMLLGYAIECALKALLLRNGHKLGTATGTLEPRFKSHKLVNLVDHTGTDVSAAEREALVWVSCYIEYMGRYPIPTKWEKWLDEPAIGFKMVSDQDQNLVTVWSDAEHLSAAEALAARLLRELHKGSH